MPEASAGAASLGCWGAQASDPAALRCPRRRCCQELPCLLQLYLWASQACEEVLQERDRLQHVVTCLEACELEIAKAHPLAGGLQPGQQHQLSNWSSGLAVLPACAEQLCCSQWRHSLQASKVNHLYALLVYAAAVTGPHLLPPWRWCCAPSCSGPSSRGQQSGWCWSSGSLTPQAALPGRCHASGLACCALCAPAHWPARAGRVSCRCCKILAEQSCLHVCRAWSCSACVAASCCDILSKKCCRSSACPCTTRLSLELAV